MNFDIQTILSFYASPFLAITFAWFAVVGYLAHVCVLMLLTKMKFAQVYQPMLRFHTISLAIAYGLTPVVTVLFCWVVSWSAQLHFMLPYQVMFFYFGWLQYWISTIFLCSFFKEASCTKFKQALFVSDCLITVLGYFVVLLIQQNFSIIG